MDYLKQSEVCDTWQKLVLACRDRFSGTAIECAGRCVSYEEFDRITDSGALALIRRGYGPGSVIGVRMRRTEKLLFAMFSVIKTGAAYLPLLLSDPESRIEEISAQSGADLIVDDDLFDEILGTCPAETETKPGAETEQRNETKQRSKTAQRSETERRNGKTAREIRAALEKEMSPAAPGDAALILFTSGSSGKPKGAQYSQRAEALVSLCYPDALAADGIVRGEFGTILAKTGQTFVSAYLFEYCPALCHGRKLVLLTEEERTSVKAITRVIRANENSSLFLTPSQIRSFLQKKSFRECLGNLSVLILAGEPLRDQLREKLIRCVPDDTQILDVYGSTEASFITVSDIREGNASGGRTPARVSLKIMEADGTVLPQLSAGEIVIHSPMMMDHYVDREQPSVVLHDRRYHKTGDAGYQTEEGRFVVTGRMDRMIKLHGLRIELQEVEINLAKHAEIAAAAVIPSVVNGEYAFLSAYYESAAEIEEFKLREFLRKHLPESMIPVRFVRLSALPLNVNRKTDYMALQELDQELLAKQAEESARTAKLMENQPETEEEALLIPLVCEVLHLETVDASQNLLALGLDSLTAYRLIGELEEYGYELTLPYIFKEPTPAAMARAMKKITYQTEDLTRAYDETKVYPATGVQIFWGTDIDDLKKSIGLYIAQTFLCERIYTEEEIQRRVSEIIRRHPAFRAEFFIDETGLHQRIREDVPITVVSQDIREEIAEGTDLKEYLSAYAAGLMQDVIAAEEITRLHISCIRVSERESVFHILTNHACADGASMCVIRQELADQKISEDKDAYLAFMTYTSMPQNFAAAQQFWKAYLSGAEAAFLKQKEDYDPAAAPDFMDFRGRTIRLSPDDTKKLEEKLSEIGISTAGFINYLYGKAILHTLRSDSVIFQLLTFGRGVPVKGMDDTVGCLLQYIPVVIRADDTPAQFRDGYIEADRYSFLPEPFIWNLAGYQEKPQLAPFLISEIFPKVSGAGHFEELNVPDYERMAVSNFIAKDENGLAVYFHFNSRQYDETEYQLMLDHVEEGIRQYLR